MTATRKQLDTIRRGLPWWWRTLGWGCCVLALLFSGPSTVVLPFLQGQVLLGSTNQGGERSPLEEDDKDLDEVGKEAARSWSDRSEHGRGRRRHQNRSRAWRAHLPHAHTFTSGYHLPLATPFERGATLPLRC